MPFWGTYFVATKGRFFADLMVRQEFYNINLNNPAFAFSNQPIGAHGWSISASTGYNFDLGQDWFIEPSAGFIYSKTSVDSFTAPGVAGANVTGITGIVQTNDVTSQIGRASVRVGKAIATPTVIWQPFASASVFHEFAGDVRSNYTSLNAALGGGLGAPFTFNQTTTTSRVGTYGQYSLGLAGQIVNTGWLGFVRVDYRNGDNIDGWTGNAGIRYQFTPETLAAVMPTKAPKAPIPIIGATNWTGFYAGGFFGAAAGRTDIAFPASPQPPPTGRGCSVRSAACRPATTTSSPTTGCSASKATSRWADVHGGRSAGTERHRSRHHVRRCFGPAGQDLMDGHGDRPRRLRHGPHAVLREGRRRIRRQPVSARPASIRRAARSAFPIVCTNQAGVVFANGTGFGTSSTRVGWTIGYGTEFDLGKNWSAKAEYDYISFGSHTALASDGTTIIRDRADISQVKVGLNYRFAPDGGRRQILIKY